MPLSSSMSSMSFNPSPIKILGHRGARGELMENTPQGFTHAYKLICKGLTGIEFDVQLTGDGQLVIFHDDSLQRLLGQQARIDQLSLLEIGRRQSHRVPIIALNELLSYPVAANAATNQFDYPATLFDAMQSFAHIELEVKTHPRTDYQALINALEESLLHHNIQRLPITLTSFDSTLLQRLAHHRSLADIPRGLLVEDASMITDIPYQAVQLGCSRVGIYHPLITTKTIDACQRMQLAVSAWTVNDLHSANRLVAAGVDALITDVPSQFLAHFHS